MSFGPTGGGQDLGSAVLTLRTDSSQFSSGLAAAHGQLKNFGSTATSAGQALTLGLTAPIIGLGAVALKSSIDFESAFAGVRKTVDATEVEFAVLRQGIRDMAKEVPASTTEISKVAEAAGQLGIQKEAILGFTRVMIDLGETTNLSSDQAATALAQFANITQMSQEDFDRLGATIVALGNAGASTEADIVELGQRLAGAGEVAGMTEAQIFAIANAMASMGINAEAGGTAFSKVILDMTEAVATGNESLGVFAAVSRLSVNEFATLFREDAAGALASFVEGLGSLSDPDLFAALEELDLDQARMRDALLRSAGAGDLLRESIELGTQAWEDNTALTEEAEKRYETTAAQLGILRNKIMDAAITFGDALLPILNDTIDSFEPLIAGLAVATKWFADLPKPIQQLAVVAAILIAALGPALIILGAMASGVAAVIALAPAMGAAASIAFGPWGLLAAALAISVGGLIVSYKLMNTEMKDLGLTAAQAAERQGDFAEMAIKGLAAIEQKVVPGLNFWSGRLKNVQDRSDDLNKHIALLKLGIDPLVAAQRSSIVALDRMIGAQNNLDRAYAEGKISTQRYKDEQLRLIAVLKTDIQVHEELKASVLNVKSAAMDLAQSGAMTQPFLAAIAAALSASDVIRGVRQGLAELQNDTMSVLETQKAVFKVGMILPELDVASVEQRMGEIRAQLAAAVSGGGGGGGGGGDSIGLAAGEQIAQDLVPAFVREMQRQEEIQNVIEQAISARDVNWSDVARLYELGAVEVAQDFAAALSGEVSNIGAQIWVAAWEEGRREAWVAGIEAAQAYTEAFASGLDELQSAIGEAFGAISSFVGTRTMEDAQLELEILIAQRDAEAQIIPLEERRAELMAEIAHISEQAEAKIARAEARAAEQIAAIQDTIDNNLFLIGVLEDNIGVIQDQIDGIERAAQAQVAQIQASINANEQLIDGLQAGIRARQSEIKAIKAAADAQVAAVQAQINANQQIINSIEDLIDANERIIKDMQAGIKAQQAAMKDIDKAANAQIAVINSGIKANESILDSLQRQLKVKQETLRADQETLSIYKKQFAEHEKLLRGFESQLKTLQDEREAAWKILGMAPGGGDLAPTLSEAAKELKDLQDQMADLLAGGGAWDVNDLGNWDESGTAATPEFLALQQSIEDAQAQFAALDAQAQAEIAAVQDKIAAQATLLAQDQALIDSIEAKIDAGKADIESIQSVIDATKEQIAADKELITAIRDAAAEQKAVIQEQIDATQETIDAVRTEIEAHKEAIAIVRERIEADQEQIDQIRASAEAQVAVIQEQIDATELHIDAIQNDIAAQKDQIDQINATADAQIDALEANIDGIRDLIDAHKDAIDASKKQIDQIEAQTDATVKAIQEEADRRIASLQAEVDQIDETIDSIKKHISLLRAEQEARELDRQILQRQLELQYQLLPTDWELLRTMLEQIQLAQQLQQVYDNMRNHALTARDAFILLGLGMGHLANLVMQIVSNPALYNLFPGFAAGGVVPGNIGQPMLAVVHGGETITPAGEQPQPVQITMNNTYNGTQNIKEVEAAQARVLNKSLRAAGLLV